MPKSELCPSGEQGCGFNNDDPINDSDNVRNLACGVCYHKDDKFLATPKPVTSEVFANTEEAEIIATNTKWIYLKTMLGRIYMSHKDNPKIRRK